MTDTPPIPEPLSPVKRALLEIRDLKAQLAAARGAWHEPLAIVGMAMRLPGGVRNAADFAALLWSGTDAIVPIPAERWSLDELYSADLDAPGKMSTRFGGFVADVDKFDAEFFGISPREAASMDPQQRLLLEVAWEALEDSGHAPDELAGSRAGVYLGISNNDYGRALYRDRDLIDPYFSTGNSYSVASGRLSYFLGAQGPSIAVDTACSSSLVAMHLACQGLRLHECDTALVGAVNLILTPEMNINFTKARMMAPDGRCKTFDGSADGYVRGEGCAVLVIRRLADAQAQGDRILAIVRGSAINQDGRSGGLTAPNGPAQEDVIRAALRSAQVDARSIGYVEAHGTGTPLGDPIEVGALGAVLGAGRDPAHPLVIGSVKTNLGHLEAAAGLAGVIKVVLSLQQREIPAHLHFKTGNPHVDWAAWPIEVPTARRAWAPIEGRRLAGVSAFGFSGTNAHVILEEAPAPCPATQEPGAGRPRPTHLMALSARDDEALADLARRYRLRLAEVAATSEAAELADLCFTANSGRSHFARRLAVTGSSAAQLSEGLASFLEGRECPGLASGGGDGSRPPKVAFLFTGQGAQHVGMGRSLYASSPVFRAALDACDAASKDYLSPGLLEVIFPVTDGPSPIDDTVFAQPVTFAIEYALAVLWRSWGIEPTMLLGHSLGEYAAACVAGSISLEDGLRVVAARGRLTHELPADGAMAAVFAAESVVAEEIARTANGLAIAAYNGPAHFVISGPRAAVQAATQQFERRGIRTRLLRVPHAAHSALVEPALPAFRQVLETVRFGAPQIALMSNVTGGWVAPGEIERVDYWLTHMREPVRFAPAMQALLEQGVTHFIEIGPHPVLLGMGSECAAAAGSRSGAVEWLASLHRDRPGDADLLESLQRLYVAGAEVDWAAFHAPQAARRIAAPTYPFRARRHWMEIVGQAPAAGIGATQRWQKVCAALDAQAERGPLDLNASSYPAKWACLRRVTIAHAVNTLRAAGLFARSGESHTLDGAMAAAMLDASYRHLVARWLEGIVAVGALRADGDAYVADTPLPDPGLPALWREAEGLFVDNMPLLDYVRHCGGLVTPVLLGHESPLETLFPGGSFEIAENLYERSATMRYINGLAASAFEALAAVVPEGRRLRVLEVGAGTGGTTSALLRVLPAGRTSYHFTDVSDFFLERARQHFGAHGFMTFGHCDIDLDPEAQGLAPGSFDAIVSANAVHASRDLRAALLRLGKLLAPGGVLVLVESTTHLPWFDMTTGLIEGWQHFADDLRTDNPLLPPEIWVGALREAGFEAAGAWPSAGSTAEAMGQHVIVARMPGEGVGAAIAAASPAASEPKRAASAQAAAVERAQAFSRGLLDALPGEQLELMRNFVRDRVLAVLRLDPADAPGRHDRLMDIGFDSLMAVQLRNQLASGVGLDKPLPATLMYDYPTIEALAVQLLDRLLPNSTAIPPIPGMDVSATHGTLGAVAIAAMSDAEIEALLTSRLQRE